MNIDWSKAPEGATHWDLGMNSRVAGWMKLDDGIWYWWPVKDAKCDMKWHSSLNQHLIEMQNFIARPCDWTGEGLPPVGNVCEYTSNGGLNWRETSVLFIDEQVVLLSGYQLYKLADPDIAFRLIRTPEQIAADKRLHEIRNALTAIKAGQQQFPNDLVRGNIVAATVEAMIDAGYRKQAPQ